MKNVFAHLAYDTGSNTHGTCQASRKSITPQNSLARSRDTSRAILAISRDNHQSAHASSSSYTIIIGMLWDMPAGATTAKPSSLLVTEKREFMMSHPSQRNSHSLRNSQVEFTDWYQWRGSWERFRSELSPTSSILVFWSHTNAPAVALPILSLSPTCKRQSGSTIPYHLILEP